MLLAGAVAELAADPVGGFAALAGDAAASPASPG